MNTHPFRYTGFWLIASALLLSTLIPGGPVENRDFSHIHPLVLGLFNVFLTTLDIGSVVLAFFAFKERIWAARGAFAAAIGFYAVYAVDLAQIFPRSPTPMSFALALIEVLGMTAAIPLMFASLRAARGTPQTASQSRSHTFNYVILTALIAIGTAVVWFATDAAMGGQRL
ncbi:MAG: hypothetical protein AAGA91_20370 [Pseudomonadota bacterium]